MSLAGNESNVVFHIQVGTWDISDPILRLKLYIRHCKRVGSAVTSKKKSSYYLYFNMASKHWIEEYVSSALQYMLAMFSYGFLQLNERSEFLDGRACSSEISF